VRDVLDAYFSSHPTARGCVLDKQGRLREHMAILSTAGSSNLPPIHCVRLEKAA